jgi:hypothetical protein
MIQLTHKQGSEDWHKARLGLATASCFDRILTPKTGKLSTQSVGYMAEKLAGLKLGHPVDDFVSEWMERGKELEPEAIKAYEEHTADTVEVVGLCLTDDGVAGCSPDGLLHTEDGPGGLEIKCPSPKEHVLNDIGGKDRFAAAHINQVQGSLWITGRDWWDLMSYHPGMPPVIVRCMRDEDRIAALRGAVTGFHDDLQAKMKTWL